MSATPIDVLDKQAAAIADEISIIYADIVEAV